MNDSDYEKIISDRSYCEEYKELFMKHNHSIENKIEFIRDNKKNFLQHQTRIENEIDNHFQTIMEQILEKKKLLHHQLRKDFVNFEENLGLIISEADHIRSSIQEKITAIELISQQATRNKTVNSIDEFFEDNTLMINESIDEEADFSNNKNHTYVKQMKKVFHEIETLINLDRKIDLIVSDDNRYLINEDVINLEKCMPDFDDKCFGHIKKKNIPRLIRPEVYELINHADFELTEIKENEFEKSKKCSITIMCPNTLNSNSEREHLHHITKFSMVNAKNKNIELTVREKTTDKRRYLRIYFIPETTGIHKLDIKVNNLQSTISPIEFVVYDPNVPSIANNVLEVIKMEPNEPRINNENAQSNNLQLAGNNSIGRNMSVVGRGRLLKNAETRKSFSSFVKNPSQKRKSPSFDKFTDLNNNLISQPSDITEITSKLKKVVVDESGNTIHNYSAPSSYNHSVSSLMELNVQVPTQGSKSRNVDYSEHDCIISNHINNNKGLVTLLNEHKTLPNLKAKFVCKYKDVQFPIGVTVCEKHQVVYICDTSNNAVKVFDNATTMLLREIKGDKNSQFHFKRPSALLLNKTGEELYVKDDKEVLVFDVGKNYKFLRKFGAEILRRPFGLAFDSNYNIVLIDANMRKPLIYVFDRITGQVISTRSYEPGVLSCSNSEQLKSRFSGDKSMPLGMRLVPFDKTKLRFICINNDNLYASDLGRSIIYKTNLQGETMLAFGYHGTEKGHINEPSGIVVDHDGKSILVGDSRNNRIQIYDDQGMYKCDIELIGEKINRPSDIHLSTDNCLYVSCLVQHTVRKYEFEKN